MTEAEALDLAMAAERAPERQIAVALALLDRDAPRASRVWTDAHDGRLRRLCERRLTVRQIAMLMGFAESAIKSRMAALGL